MTASNPLNSPQFDTLDAIVREYVRVKLQGIDIRNYNGANLAYTHAADMANKLGLDEKQKIGITPFPAPTTVNIQQAPQEPRQPPQSPPAEPVPIQARPEELLGESTTPATRLPSWLPPLLGGAAGVAATLLAGKLFFSPPPAAPAKPPEKPPAQVVNEGGEGEVGLVVEGIGE